MLRPLLERQAREAWGRTKTDLTLLAGYRRKSSKLAIRPSPDGLSVEVSSFWRDCWAMTLEFPADEVPLLAEHVAREAAR